MARDLQYIIETTGIDSSVAPCQPADIVSESLNAAHPTDVEQRALSGHEQETCSCCSRGK